MAKQKTTPRGRNAKNGEFITVEKAKTNPDHTVVERVPVRTKKKK